MSNRNRARRSSSSSCSTTARCGFWARPRTPRRAATCGHGRTRVSRVLAIVAELQNTLDVEKGGAVADQLDDLYTYITSRLLDVALKNDVTAIEEARKLLTPIRDAWSQLATQSRRSRRSP